MKTKQKILKLMEYGIKPTTLGTLSENQLNSLYSRLLETKKKLESKEATTKTETKTYTDYSSGEVNTMKSKGQTINVKDGQVQALPDGGLRVVQETEDTDDDIALALGAEGDSDLALAISEKELQEKFESKKQQKYFFSKCGDGKTKEEKKWCKMAEEFADKTNFKKLPEKKMETKEGYLDMIGKAMNKNMGNEISNFKLNLKWESELERNITRLLENNMNPKMTKKDFLRLVSEQGTKEKEAPTTKPKETTKPGTGTPYKAKPGPAKAPKAETKEGTETAPVKPKEKEKTRIKPSTPYSPKPGPAKAPKANKGKLPTWLTFKSIGIKLK